MSISFMIVGADFKNKGGQSMLFHMIDFLRRNFPECKIFVPMTNISERIIYNFDIFYYDYDTQKIALSRTLPIRLVMKSILKKIFKNRDVEIFALNKNIKKTDWLIDISGYNLSSDWNMATNEKYLRYIELAEKNNVSVVLMPQSFGPFNYSEDIHDYICDRIRKCLQYCSLVIAREQSARDQLIRLGIENVKLTPDLVLQGDEINVDYIYKREVPLQKEIEVLNNAVVILPNMKSFEHGKREEIILLYIEIVDKLKKWGKNIYLMRHAKEDIEACKWIYQEIKDQKNVILIQEEFNVFEYEKIVKKFDFIIASRYHSIVHAYKNGVPAIVLGWSEKYNELVKHFAQSNYQFSITGEIGTAKILTAVETMIRSFSYESEVICRSLNKLREENNCFNMLLDVVRKGIKDD